MASTVDPLHPAGWWATFTQTDKSGGEGNEPPLPASVLGALTCWIPSDALCSVEGGERAGPQDPANQSYERHGVSARAVRVRFSTSVLIVLIVLIVRFRYKSTALWLVVTAIYVAIPSYDVA